MDTKYQLVKIALKQNRWILNTNFQSRFKEFIKIYDGDSQ